MLNVRHTPSRAKGTPSSFILSRSSMGIPQDGPPRVQWQDPPGHQWLLFQMGWDEAPCQADQHRDYPPGKECIAAHRLPDVIVTDSGTQFSSQDFADFASSYGFTHVTSSPKHPQASGKAEKAVQTIKQLLKKNKDPYLALLMYRATPLQNGLSPSELMGRKLKTWVAIFSQVPETHNTWSWCHQSKRSGHQKKKRLNFNQRHATRELPPLQPGDPAPVPTSSKHRKGLSLYQTQPSSHRLHSSSGAQCPASNSSDTAPVTRTADTTHSYAAMCCLPVTNSSCSFTTCTFQPADNSAHEIQKMCE